MQTTKARVALAALPLIVALFDDALAALPSQLVPLLQEGYLERKFEDYAEPENVYGALADPDTFEEQIGTTLTKTRPGLKAPIQLATDAATAADDGALNNGITPSDVSVEQYTLTPETYEDGMDLDLIGTHFTIVNRFGHNVKVNVVQSYQSRDLLARDTLIAGYFAGTTKAIAAGSAALSATVTSTVHVDDQRGLDTIVYNGQVKPVANAANYQLLATVFPGGSSTGAYNVYVVGAAADGTNATQFVLVGSPAGTGGATASATRGNGVSGTLTLLGAPAGVGAFNEQAVSGVGKTLASGDVIIAVDAPKQFIAGAGNIHWSQLTASNLLTQSQLLDGKSWLEDQGMEPLDDGTFLCIGSSRSFRGLFGDADFKQAFQALGMSPFFRKGRVDTYLGITFLPTTNAPRIALPGGGGFVHVPMLIGKGALIDAWFTGMEEWARSQFNDAYIALQDGIAQIISAPIDRNRRKLKMSWLTIRDMNAPTDVTVNSNIILTSGGGRRKRAVMLPHGASV
jgi:hypothetical protein